MGVNMNDEIASFEENMGVKLPKHRIVCPTCNGEGQHGPGWVFTEEDRYEMGYEFDELMEDLRAGRYNVTCDDCKGLRVVEEVDEDQLDEQTANEWRHWMAEAYEQEAIYRMERMMGA